MAGGGGQKKRFQYCSDSSGTILYLRAFQGHSGRNLIDSPLQDNVIIVEVFFKYIYHVGCAINLHSIINSGLIPGGQNLSNRQTVFFLPVDPMDKEHKDPETIDLGAPRLAQYMHKPWKKKSKYGVLGRHQPCSKERIKVLSDAIERHHSLQYSPSLFKDASTGMPGERGKARVRASSNHVKGAHDRSDRQHSSQESKSTRAMTYDLRKPSSVKNPTQGTCFP